MDLVLFKVKHKGKELSVVDVQKTHYAVAENKSYVPKTECEVIENTDVYRGLNASGERENKLYDAMQEFYQDSALYGRHEDYQQAKQDTNTFLNKLNDKSITEQELIILEKRYINF